MSKILEHLKQAEAQRERIVAERRQLEAEANAALAAREREELAGRARGATPAAPAPDRETRAPGRWLLAGLAALVLIAGIAAAFLYSGENQSLQQPARAVSAADFGLRLDRDAAAFAARVREKERQ